MKLSSRTRYGIKAILKIALGHGREPVQVKTIAEQEDIFIMHRPEEELYRVGEDPYQFTNLAGEAEHEEILQTLRGIMDEWIEETGDGVSPDITRDRQTLEGMRDPEWHHGTMPGSKFGADTITRPGPIRLIDL